MSLENWFICKECGFEVSRISGPEPIEGEICFLCRWITDNKHMTEQEKKELRQRFRPKPRLIEDV